MCTKPYLINKSQNLGSGDFSKRFILKSPRITISRLAHDAQLIPKIVSILALGGRYTLATRKLLLLLGQISIHMDYTLTHSKSCL